MRTNQTSVNVRSLGGRLKRLEHLAIEQSQQLAALHECLERLSRRGDDMHDGWARLHGDFQRRAEDLHALVYDLRAGLDPPARPSIVEPTAKPSYPRVIRRIREAVRRHVPPDGTIIVATKGDEELLDLHGRGAWHFPQAENNLYAGHHPANSTAAIVQMEFLRSKGADYFLLPATALWWLDHYGKFREHLERRYQVVFRDDRACLLFALRAPAGRKGVTWARTLNETIEKFRSHFDAEPSVLDWNTGLGLTRRLSDIVVFEPFRDLACLPYLDKTIDIVAVPAGDEANILAPLRVSILPASPELLEVLEGWGIHTFKSLAALPPITLTERLGQQGLTLQKLAQGRTTRPLKPLEPTPDFIGDHEFEDPIETLDLLAFDLNRVLKEICDRLVAQSLATNELRLTLDLEVRQIQNGKDGEQYNHNWKLPVPTQDRHMLFTLFRLNLERNTFSAPIKKLTIEAVPVKPRIAQGNLFAPPSPEAEKLEITLARIRGVVGTFDAEGINCVGSPQVLSTHKPGAFAVQSFSSAAERWERSECSGCSRQVQDASPPGGSFRWNERTERPFLFFTPGGLS